MNTFTEFQEQDRRLVLLRALSAAAQYRANALLLQRYCDAVGHIVSIERIEADLNWLFDSALVGLTREGDLTIATLTARGMDVGAGRSVIRGVARPQPGG